MKVKELLADESKWTQGVYARAANGRPTLVDHNAVCWCLDGAIRHCYPAAYDDVVLRQKLSAYFVPLGTNIIRWNDDPARTFEEVQALVHELDI